MKGKVANDFCILDDPIFFNALEVKRAKKLGTPPKSKNVHNFPERETIPKIDEVPRSSPFSYIEVEK